MTDKMTAEQALEWRVDGYDKSFWEWWEVTNGTIGYRVDNESEAKYLCDLLNRQALTAPRVPEGWCVSTSKYGIIVTGPHGQSGEAVRPGTGFGSTDPVVYRLLQELFAAAQAPAEVNFVEAFNGDVPFPAPGQSLAEACAYVNGVAGGLYVGKHNQARKDADELATLRERYDALLAKHQDVLDTVQQCACAYDGPQDVCVGHSNQMAVLRERVKVLEANYSELLYQVHEVIPGQSRHETALARLRAHNNLDNQPEAARLRGGSDE